MLDGVQLYQEEKTPAQVFSCNLSKIFKKTDFADVRTNAWVKWTKKNVFTKAIHGKTSVTASFLVQLQIFGLTVFPEGLQHRCFSVKAVKFYRMSFLQNTAAQLLLISSNIFNEPLDLSVRN